MQLTEEELELQKKYNILRRQKKILSDLKKQRKEALKSSSSEGGVKVSTSTAGSQIKTPKDDSKGSNKNKSSSKVGESQKKGANNSKSSAGNNDEVEKTAEQRKQEAKMLVAKGLIKINTNDRKKQEFKRSRNLERRLEDPEKSVNVSVEFTPFSAASDMDEDLKGSNSSFAEMKRKMSYDNYFVKGRDRRDGNTDEDDEDLERRVSERDRERQRERDRDRERQSERDRDRLKSGPDEPPSKKSAIHRDDLEGRGEERKKHYHKKGNTVFVKGHGLNEDIVRTAFDRYGKILNIKMDSDNRHNWFVTYADQNDAASAIRDRDGTVVSEIHLHVALARHQPDIEGFVRSSAAERETAGGSFNKAHEWTSVALSQNHKSEHQDQRSMITYDIDDEFD